MQVKNGPNFDSNLEHFAQRHLKSLGYEIRNRDKSLPGTPDIVLPSRRVAVLVHGCFYHCHGGGCRDSFVPATRRVVWEQKFARTRARDRRDTEQLMALGYRVVVIWGCALRFSPLDHLLLALKTFIEGDLPHQELGMLEVSWLSAAPLLAGRAGK